VTPRRRAALAVVLAAGGGLGGCTPDRSPSEPPTAADLLTQLKQGGSGSVAVTAPAATDPRLQPHTYPGRASEVARCTEQVITPLPRWDVVTGKNGVIWLTRRTRLGFVDDVYLLLLPARDSTVVFARSASRVGAYDFGQNRRNLGELWRALAPLAAGPCRA
jgi:uncharacterized protein (DUF1499 family)